MSIFTLYGADKKIEEEKEARGIFFKGFFKKEKKKKKNGNKNLSLTSQPTRRNQSSELDIFGARTREGHMAFI